MDLKAYLEQLVTKTNYPITFSGDDTNTLSRWLVRAGRSAGSEPPGTAPHFDPARPARLLMPSEQEFLSTEEKETNWRLYIAERIDRFQQENSPQDLFQEEDGKYVYALSNLYSEAGGEALLNLITYLPGPMRVWLNGQLVFSGTYGYFNKNAFIMAVLEPGNNTFMVEFPLFSPRTLWHRCFLVKLMPVERLKEADSAHKLLDEDFLSSFHSRLHLFPDNVFYKQGEQIGLVVLPYRIAGSQGEALRVACYDVQGRLLHERSAWTGERMCISLDGEYTGVVRITAQYLERPDTISDVFVCLGSWTEYCQSLIQAAEARKDACADAARTIAYLSKIPSVFEKINYYMNADLVNSVLKQTASFAAYTMTEEHSVPRSVHEIFGSSVLMFSEKKESQGFTSYHVYFPEGYDASRTYPLVIYGTDAQGYYYPLDLTWLKRTGFNEAIIVNMITIGSPNYADDMNYVATVKEVTERFRIDRNRIYGIGFCTGVLKLYRLSFALPDLFAGIATVLGDARLNINDPQFELFDNASEVSFMGLCTTEDWFINISRNLDHLKRLKRSKAFTFNRHKLLHEEFNDYFNSKTLFQKLLNEEKETFPRQIRFTVTEPWYNKSFWIKADCLDDVQRPAYIEAEIRSSSFIEVQMSNVQELGLLLSRADMGLDRELRLSVNGVVLQVGLDAYSNVRIAARGPQVTATTVPISELSFKQAYEAIGVDEAVMGIKRIYVNNPLVIKPDRKLGRNPLATKLSYLLQSPIKNRVNVSTYGACTEAELDSDKWSEHHFVLSVDTRKKSVLQQELLDRAGLALGSDGMEYEGELFSGVYFALLTCANPWNPDKELLIAAYNSDEIEGELLGLLNAFEDNPLLRFEALIYHNQRYHTFRNRQSRAFGAENEESKAGSGITRNGQGYPVS